MTVNKKHSISNVIPVLNIKNRKTSNVSNNLQQENSDSWAKNNLVSISSPKFSSSTSQQQQEQEQKQQQNNKTKQCENSIKVTTSRKLLFEYPPLPEIYFCYIIVISALLYAWFCVFQTSQKWALRMGNSIPLQQLPFFGLRFKDEINWEWLRWSPFALSYLPYLIGHSILFNSIEKFVPENVAVVLNTSFSIFASIQIFGAQLVAFTILQGLFIFGCTYCLRRMPTVWLSSLPSLYLVMNHSTLLSTDIFHVLLFASYTLLSYISFCLDWSSGQTRKEDKTIGQLLRRMMFYAFYQPYLFSLIVTYTDFERQIEERKTVERNLKAIVWRLVRVAFWWTVLEVMLHFFYFETILHDLNFASKLPKNQFVTLGMALGSFFHMKYTVIFGLPIVFAQIDGMQPPGGPICISRVALYSKIWRGFDRGLYAFFKTYIFIPICAPTFSIGRRILGVFVSYTFVLIWHGFHHQNIVWIGLNIVELFIEYGAKGIYSIKCVKEWREKNISDVNFRRFLGWGQIFPFAFGLYSNFYFLGGSRVGWMFVQRIFIEETITLRWPFFLLIIIGYFFMQLAMEFERYFSKRKEEKDSSEKLAAVNPKQCSSQKKRA